MTKAHLRACSSCARHVRVSEEACPFCGSALSDSFRAASAPQGPGARLTRAALFAFGAGTLAITPACSSSSSPSPTPDAGQTSGFDGGVQPAYGGPTFEDSGLTTVDAGGSDAGTLDRDTGVPAPVYGAPALDGGPAGP